MISISNAFVVLESFQYFFEVYNWVINIFSNLNINIKYFVVYLVSIVLFISVIIPQIVILIFCFLWYTLKWIHGFVWLLNMTIFEWLWILTKTTLKSNMLSAFQLLVRLFMNAKQSYASCKLQPASGPSFVRSDSSQIFKAEKGKIAKFYQIKFFRSFQFFILMKRIIKCFRAKTSICCKLGLI
jgi:hypothetical protein